MLKNNVINPKFKNYKETKMIKRKRRTRLLAILGCILVLSSLVGSIIFYL